MCILMYGNINVFAQNFQHHLEFIMAVLVAYHVCYVIYEWDSGMLESVHAKTHNQDRAREKIENKKKTTATCNADH